MTSPRLAIATILAGSALAACQSVDPVADRGGPGTLRAAIFARYDELAHANALPHANGADRVDFSSVVQPFFKSVSSLPDAQALLTQNGFTMQAQPPRAATGDPHVDAYRSFVVGQLMIDNRIVWRADLSCNIAPGTVQHDIRFTATPNCWLSTTSL